MLSQTTGQHIVACRPGTTRGCSTKVHVRYTPYLFILRTQSIPAPSISAIDGVVAGTFASRYAMSAHRLNACGTGNVASYPGRLYHQTSDNTHAKATESVRETYLPSVGEGLGDHSAVYPHWPVSRRRTQGTIHTIRLEGVFR